MNAPDLARLYPGGAATAFELFVLRCVIDAGRAAGEAVPVRGLSQRAREALWAACGAGAAPTEAEPAVFDEFDELFALLGEYVAPADDTGHWLAAAIASAAQRDNHLWQDMGLPSRGELSAILGQRFPALAARNSGDMKWKKFFYRQLCERAGVPICKSPNCMVCVDHAQCFGAEE